MLAGLEVPVPRRAVVLSAGRAPRRVCTKPGTVLVQGPAAEMPVWEGTAVQTGLPCRLAAWLVLVSRPRGGRCSWARAAGSRGPLVVRFVPSDPQARPDFRWRQFSGTGLRRPAAGRRRTRTAAQGARRAQKCRYVEAEGKWGTGGMCWACGWCVERRVPVRTRGNFPLGPFRSWMGRPAGCAPWSQSKGPV